MRYLISVLFIALLFVGAQKVWAQSDVMFLRLLKVNVKQDKLPEIRALDNSDEVDGVLKGVKGFRFRYLLESVENPGEIISITGWDSKADGDAYEQSGSYNDIKDKFSKWFTSTPELKTYEVNSYLVQE